MQKIFSSKNNKFNIKTVLTISLQIIDILEYIHSKGFVHSDIKASNILLAKKKVTTVETKKESDKKKLVRYEGSAPLRTCRLQKVIVNKNLRQNNRLKYINLNTDQSEENLQIQQVNSADQVYLLDYGLASKYMKEKGHAEFCRDERKAHAGTVLFCSLDAHLGAQSRRSDLECLGYNMIYWLTGYLPWMDDIDDPLLVEKKKHNCLCDLKSFLNLCFNQYPKFMYDYFKYLGELEFKSKPDYQFLRKLFEKGLIEYGYKCDSRLDFNSLEGWGQRPKKTNRNVENIKTKKVVICRFKRSPLHSNIAVKPLLRKKIKKAKSNELIWSKILQNDPEEIIKQAARNKTRDRKITETMDSSELENLDIHKLQPTYHMLNVYNRYIDKISNALGYTPNSSYDR